MLFPQVKLPTAGAVACAVMMAPADAPAACLRLPPTVAHSTARRLKAKREHRVPLSAPAIAIIKGMMATADCELVFPGARRNRPLASMAMLTTLDRMGRRDVATTHGFRASLKTWASERTNFAREVVEAALAHVEGDKVEAAYQRGDLFDKRRRLMNAWADYITKRQAVGNVVPLAAAQGA
jgi:integrase